MAKNPEPVRAALAAGQTRRALRLAAAYKHLGEQKERIQRGAAALRDPDVYRDMNQDPEALVNDGIEATKERFGATPDQPARTRTQQLLKDVADDHMLVQNRIADWLRINFVDNAPAWTAAMAADLMKHLAKEQPPAVFKVIR